MIQNCTRFYILIISCFLGFHSLQAQGIGGGGSAGFVLSQVDGDRYGGYEKIGYQLGGFAWYAFDERWSLKPEILVTNRGSRSIENNFKLSFTYLDVPVYAGFKVFDGRGGALTLEAGFSAGYLLKARKGFAAAKDDVEDSFDRLDLGVTGGLTYQVAPMISFAGRLSYSVMDIRKGNNMYTSGYTTNNYLTFSLRVHSK